MNTTQSKTWRQSARSQLATAILFASLFSSFVPAQNADRIPETASKSIEEAVDRLIERRGFPGFSIGIVFEDDLIYTRSFGVRDRDTRQTADKNTFYQIGSISKVFTATLLVKLRDEGLLRLDDPIAKFLPRGVTLPGANGELPSITLRHLATHTSGLPTNVVNPSRAQDGDPWTGYTTRQMYAGLRDTKLAFPTGSRWGYSNLGFGLLGQALESAGRGSYESLLRRHLLSPLKMENTTISLTRDVRAQLATPYRDDNTSVKTEPWDLGVLSPAGGISSSVFDLAKFLSLHMRAGQSGVTLVRGSSLLEMQTPQRFIVDWRSANGLGWRIDHTARAGDIVSHGGDVDGYAAYIAFSSVHKIGVIILTNSGIGQPVGQLGEWMMALAVESIRPAQSKLPGDAEANAYFEREDWKNAAWSYESVTTVDSRNGAAFSRLGITYLRVKDYDRAAAAYQKALKLGFRPPNTMYNLACAFSLKGDVAQAIDWLKQALKAGFENINLLKTDTDLDYIRNDSRFKEILQNYK